MIYGGRETLRFFPLSPPFSYFLFFSAVSPFVGGNRRRDAQMDYGDAYCVRVRLSVASLTPARVQEKKFVGLGW